jgi:hypothetical protein
MEPEFQGRGSELAKSPKKSLEALDALLQRGEFRGKLTSPIKVSFFKPWPTGWKDSVLTIIRIPNNGFDGLFDAHELSLKCPDGTIRKEELPFRGVASFTIQPSGDFSVVAVIGRADETEEGVSRFTNRAHVVDLEEICRPLR